LSFTAWLEEKKFASRWLRVLARGLPLATPRPAFATEFFLTLPEGFAAKLLVLSLLLDFGRAVVATFMCSFC